MTTVEENERLVRVGPGTAMGGVLRRYWIPFLPSADLGAEGEPKRVRLLGEELVAFRNRDGRVGVLDRYCPHRGVDLFYGRNEQCGLRCIYHGWKMELDGQVSDMPNLRAGTQAAGRVRTTAYPTYDDGTVLWAYLGPPEARPSRPPAIWEATAAEQVSVRRIDCRGNWLQHLEGQIDSSHVAFLHSYRSSGPHLFGDEAAYTDPNPDLEIVDTGFGAMFAWLRKGKAAGSRNVRMAQWAAPFMTGIAGFVVDGNHQFHFAVPEDDEHTIYLVVSHDPLPVPPRDDSEETRRLGELRYAPGSYRLELSPENDYEIDREMQRTQNFSGIASLRVQDLAVQELVRGGPVADRTREHLVATDRAILFARRRLARLMDRLEADGTLAEPGLLAEVDFRPFDHDVAATTDVGEHCRASVRPLRLGVG
ncbi:MAG: Rieske 2Fe-2S domain-containing protein [Actinomycetota bacterium]|nr:Rieske 2Fe-2S domain-containing protein [Actinomycetota bacterium]